MRRKPKHRDMVEAVWDALADANNGKTSLLAVQDEAAKKIPASEWDTIKADYIAGLVRMVDDAKQQRANDAQLSLWDSAPQFLDGFWSTGGGDRVRVRKATWTDLQLHLREVSENAARVNAAAARKQRLAAEITPYFVTALTTYEDALAAWKQANPRQQAAGSGAGVARPII